MAIANSDGSIILETKIDNSGVNKGVAAMRKRATELDNSFENVEKTIISALNSGNIKVANLANNFKKATEEVEKQSAKVEELKAKLAELENGNGSDTPQIKKMRVEFEKTNESVEKTKQEIANLYAQLDVLQMNAFKDPTTQEPVFTDTEQSEFDSVNAKITELEARLTSAEDKANKLGKALRNASGSATQAEIDKTKAELENAENKLGNLSTKSQIAGKKLQAAMNGGATALAKVKNAASSATSAMQKLGKRIASTVKSALLFSAVSKVFTSLRTTIGNTLMSNDQFRSALERLKNSLWTAFAPIYNAIVPALTTLINWINQAITAVTKFFAKLAGKSYESLVANGKALKKQTENYQNLGKAATKASKSLANFDEINQIQTKEAEEGNNGNAAVSEAPVESKEETGNAEILKATLLENLGEFLKIASKFLVAIGVILLCTGNIPFGIGCILAGLLAGEISDVVEQAEGDTPEEKINSILSSLKEYVGDVLFVLGVVLICFGQIPLGIGAMVAGAILYNIENMDGDFDTLTVEGKIAVIEQAVGAALFVLGVVLICFGQILLGIGAMVAGAALFGVAEKTLDKEAIKTGISKFLDEKNNLIFSYILKSS